MVLLERREALRTALVAAIILGACGPDASRPSGSEIPVLDVELDLRIDGNEQDLVPITWFGVSPAGQIALIQWQDHSVRFYDASGVALGSVGREGEGPGEFRRPVRGGWFGDTLWVSDTQINRITLISPALDVVEMFTPPATVRESVENGEPATLYGAPFVWGMLARDTLLVVPLQAVDAPPIDAKNGIPALSITRDGHLVRDLARMPMDEGGSVSVQVSGGMAYAQIPFFPRSEWSISPDGSRIAVLRTSLNDPEGPAYRVRVVDNTGAELINRAFPYEPVPIPGSRLDSAITAAASRRPQIQAEVEAKLRKAAPATYPAAEHVLVGADHRIWVGLRAEPEGRPWVVLSAVGEPVGHLVLPANTTLRAANDTHIWAVERDELDVESVVRYRLLEGRH